MKYCTNCGNEMQDGEAFCSRCGKPADGQVAPAPVQSAPMKDDQATLNTVIKVFMIIGCIINACYFLIPLLWCVPMTISAFKKMERGERIGTGFKVCTLLFVNLIAGILLVIRNEPQDK